MAISIINGKKCEIYHKFLNLKVVVMSVAVELSNNSILKPEMKKNVFRKVLTLLYCIGTEESDFMTCLFIILVYSLPQPPRHSWLPEKISVRLQETEYTRN